MLQNFISFAAHKCGIYRPSSVRPKPVLKDQPGKKGLMSKCKEILTEEELNRVVREAAAESEVHLFIGFGSAAMYADVNKVLENLRPELSAIESRCKGKPFLAVYGGDSSEKEEPSIGWLMEKIKDHYDCKILAIVADGRGPDPHWTYSFKAPKQHYLADGKLCYGGTVTSLDDVIEDSVPVAAVAAPTAPTASKALSTPAAAAAAGPAPPFPDGGLFPVGATRFYLGPGFIQPQCLRPECFEGGGGGKEKKLASLAHPPSSAVHSTAPAPAVQQLNQPVGVFPGGKAPLTSVLVMGGGGVALKEVQYADKMGVPWKYFKSETKNKKAYPDFSDFGPVEDWCDKSKKSSSST